MFTNKLRCSKIATSQWILRFGFLTFPTLTILSCGSHSQPSRWPLVSLARWSFQGSWELCAAVKPRCLCFVAFLLYEVYTFTIFPFRLHNWTRQRNSEQRRSHLDSCHSTQKTKWRFENSFVHSFSISAAICQKKIRKIVCCWRKELRKQIMSKLQGFSHNNVNSTLCSCHYCLKRRLAQLRLDVTICHSVHFLSKASKNDLVIVIYWKTKRQVSARHHQKSVAQPMSARVWIRVHISFYFLCPACPHKVCRYSNESEWKLLKKYLQAG